MPLLKPVAREREEVVFKPIPGQEDDWAFVFGDNRSRLWDGLGTYPIIGFIVLMLILLGAAQ